MPELYLLTGEIGSGKTTALLKWIEKRKNVSGILSPVIGGKRVFMDVSTKKLFPMEAAAGSENILEIGKYKFDKKSFEKAASILSLSKEKQGWLIVDEIGPLELKKQGFYEIVKTLPEHNNDKLNLLFVIRKSLLQESIDLFQLQRFSPQIITVQSAFFRNA